MKRYLVIVPCAGFIEYEVEAEDESAAISTVEAGKAEGAKYSEPLLNMDTNSWDVEEIGEAIR